MLPSFIPNSQKLTFATQARLVAVKMALALEEAYRVDRVYNDRLYGPGGANAINDEDIAQLGITADQLYAFIILCNQVNLFAHNQAATPANYASTANAIRNDI